MFTKTVFPTLLLPVAMWMFLFLYSVYFTVISAHKFCPDVCECEEKKIKCAGQKLSQIPKRLPKDVTNLDLSGNKLFSFENNTFLEFSNLTELNLTDNEITDVASLGAFPKSLKILYLKGNKLKALNGNWSQFIKLDFSQNAIDVIGKESFKGVKDLKELKLDGNNLTVFPEIEGCSLKILDLSNNKISSINDFSRDMYRETTSFEILKLSDNQIKSLGIAAFSGLKVKRLYLDGNLLKTVDKNWMFGMMSLEYLHLENNNIMNISSSEWKYCCKKLKYLNLAHNNLKEMVFGKNKKNIYGGNFMDLLSLETLNLASNKIFYISDDAFKHLENLRTLDLSNNKISLVKNSTFGKLQKLEELDMRSNPIGGVNRDSFSTKLSDLKISSKELYCDCTQQWFSEWLKKKRFSDSVGLLKCKKPNKLFGRNFKEIPITDLVCDSSRPQIITDPQSQTAITGESVRLSCAVKNGSINGLQILWKKNNVDMNEAKVTKLTQTEKKFSILKSVLTLSNVTDTKDSGAYQCFVLTGKERISSQIARLDVYAFPKFTSTPGDLVTTTGKDVYFNCSASGHPQPVISIKPPSNFQAVSEGRISIQGNTFVLRNISRSDSGLYHCFAESDAGKINATFALNIIGKPVAQHEMLDKVILINDAAVFVCAASAWPLPQYTWFKDGKKLNLTSNNLQLLKKQNAQHLIVLHVGYSDAGSYKCRVSNSHGYIELSSHLKVVKDLSDKPAAPEDKSVFNKTLIGVVVFTAACTMVVTTLICVAVLYALTRRGCNCFTRQKTSETITLDSYATTDPENQVFPDESPRSSSTFVTSSDSRAHSDVQTSGSESGTTKERRKSSDDGPHSSGVCSLSSSNSSLSSNLNHRNTFPFSNAKTYLYQGAGEDNSKDVICKHGHPKPRQSLQHKANEEYYSGRRKQRSSSGEKPSRSRERHVNTCRKGLEQERLKHPLKQTNVTDEYRTESVTESEGTVL